MTIKFFIQGTKNPSPIYVRLRGANNLDAKARTRWNINPSDWSKVKGQPKNLKNAEYKILKNDLDNFSTELANEINKLNANVTIDTPWLKRFISPDTKNDELQIPIDIIGYIEHYIESKGKDITANSIQKYRTVKHKLQKLQVEKGKTILIKDINEDFKSELVNFCDKEGYSSNTIHRTLGFIKTFCKHARHNGLEVHHQLDKLKVSKEKTEKIYLTFDELEKIEKADIDSTALSNARDWLIISCFCGQRVSDFLNFSKDLLRREKGVTLIEFTQKKTGKRMGLPLHPKVLDILKKNKGEFPYKIADQKYNEHIKEVCKLAGINDKIKGSKIVDKRKKKGTYPKYELVTSHIGRRSFATNFYGKIPTPLLMSATGHSTEKMFLEYIGKSATDQALELANYFNQ